MVDQRLVEEVNLLHARICQALADPTRILILYALAERPHYVNELAETLGIRQPAASHHLKNLRDRGLVTAERDGNTILYALRDQRVVEALDMLRDLLGSILREDANLFDTDIC